MSCISIYYLNGNIDVFTASNYGHNYAGDTAVQNEFIMFNDMEEKGIRLQIGRRDSKDNEEAIAPELLLVEPDYIDHVYKVMKDNLAIAGLDENGKLLNPVEYEQYMRMLMEVG